MPADAPWVLAVQADTSGVDEREELARSLEAKTGEHADWVVLETCHRVELYGFGAVPELDARQTVETGEDAVRHLLEGVS